MFFIFRRRLRQRSFFFSFVIIISTSKFLLDVRRRRTLNHEHGHLYSIQCFSFFFFSSLPSILTSTSWNLVIIESGSNKQMNIAPYLRCSCSGQNGELSTKHMSRTKLRRAVNGWNYHKIWKKIDYVEVFRFFSVVLRLRLDNNCAERMFLWTVHRLHATALDKKLFEQFVKVNFSGKTSGLFMIYAEGEWNGCNS